MKCPNRAMDSGFWWTGSGQGACPRVRPGWISGSEIAPSATLRKWFGHDPSEMDSVPRPLFSKNRQNPERSSRLGSMCRRGVVTLVYVPRTGSINDAVALKEYLDRKGGISAVPPTPSAGQIEKTICT